MFPLSFFQYRNLFFVGVAAGKTATSTSNIILEYYIIRGMTGTTNHCKIRLLAIPLVTVSRKRCYTSPKTVAVSYRNGRDCPAVILITLVFKNTDFMYISSLQYIDDIVIEKSCSD